MVDSVRVRTARREDATGIADLMVRGDWLEAIMTGFYEDIRGRTERKLALQCGRPEHVCVVAELRPGLISGYAAGTVVELASAPAPAMIVTELFTAPVAASCEIEVQLLRAIEEEARKLGAMVVTKLVGPSEEEVAKVLGSGGGHGPASKIRRVM